MIEDEAFEQQNTIKAVFLIKTQILNIHKSELIYSIN